MAEKPGERRFSVGELAAAAPLPIIEVERLIGRGMLVAGEDGRYGASDIQRVRAVIVSGFSQ